MLDVTFIASASASIPALRLLANAVSTRRLSYEELMDCTRPANALALALVTPPRSTTSVRTCARS